MRWIAAVGLAGLALAGCGQETNEDALTDEAGADAQEQLAQAPDDAGSPQDGDAADDSADEADDAASNESGQAGDDDSDGGDDRPGAGLPPAGEGLRFVGLWASSAANCDNLAWRFSANRLQTPAGSVCTFDEVTPVPGGYDIAATCTAEGPPTEDRLEIRFAESAKAMLFESDSIADAGLVYCGRDG